MKWDAQDINDIRERIDIACSHLDEVNQGLRNRMEEGATETPVEAADVQVILEASENTLRTMEALMSVTMGECRLDRPFAPLMPVIDSDGYKWCCTHDPEHCSR